MADCLFCRIVAGKIPAGRVWEDEQSVAFRDISPQAPTHILVIPRRHLSGLADTQESDAELLGHLLGVARQVAQQEGIGSGYRVVINNGAEAGQSVFHLHFHILGGRRLGWPPG